MRDGHLWGALPRTPTARQVDVLAAFVAAEAPCRPPLGRSAFGRAPQSATWLTCEPGPVLLPSS